MAIDEQEVGPAVIVEAKKHDSPAEILSVQAKTRGERGVRKIAITIVSIERGCVIGKIRLEDVEVAIAVIVGNGRSHSSLGPPILVEGCAGYNPYIGECPIAIVAIKNARSAITGHIDIGPSVIVVIQSGDTEAIMPGRILNASLLSHISKLPVAEVVIEQVTGWLETAGAAHDRNPLPMAIHAFAGSRGGAHIEVDIVGDH